MKQDRAKILKQWRADMGLTQYDLAELLGYKSWAISSWEQGRNPVPDWLLLVMKLITKPKLDKILGRK